MKSFIFGLALTFLLGWTLVLRTYHAGVAPVPELPAARQIEGTFISKDQFGMHHLLLSGNPYERGLQSGSHTRDLLLKQEDVLFDQLSRFLPSKSLLPPLTLAGIWWFGGVEKYIEPWMLQEMYGVSRFAPQKYDHVIDGYTRQIVYHGIHEVGQMSVDQGLEAMGCTVIAHPLGGQWVLGRNFDFEAGRVFDEEKILKWVFPDEGHAFLSVIWAGMVGAVTGVNDQGLYISLNAAGSEDFRRIGLPSTLVALKVLQFAKDLNDAIEILRREQVFITDIYVLLDAKTGRLVRVEKSPARFAVVELQGPSVVANHLIADIWKDDKVNRDRRQYLTSTARQDRGEELLGALKGRDFQKSPELEIEVLKILRDKGRTDDGKPLHLGHRRAIDALIATHSVIYNSRDRVFYVGKGPAVAGAFVGYDLEASFRERKPVFVRELPADPDVTPAQFKAIQESWEELRWTRLALWRKDCDAAQAHLELAAGTFKEQGDYYLTLGKWHECRQEMDQARAAWRHALDLVPAYHKDRLDLERKLQ